MKQLAFIALIFTAIRVGVSQEVGNHNSGCVCTPYHYCSPYNYGMDVDEKSNSGPEIECTGPLDICCPASHVIKHPPQSWIDKGCGYRNRNSGGMKAPNNNTANEAEFPWVAYIVNSVTKVVLCTGSLIDRKVFLTTAACLKSFSVSQLHAIAGRWDVSIDNATYTSQNLKVQSIIKHPNFRIGDSKYNYALVILEESFIAAENVGVICLPESDNVFDSSGCITTGLASQKLPNSESSKISFLNINPVSTVSESNCRQNFLGSQYFDYFDLEPSFICGEVMRKTVYDACLNQSGDPLICPLKSDPEHYVQVGISPDGAGCQDHNITFYSNVIYARPWINEIMNEYKIGSASYTPNLNTHEVSAIEMTHVQ